MTEQTLFEYADLARVQAPLARDKDPITSHEAADKAIKSGLVDSEVEQVREYITRFCKVMMRPDFTAKEIAWFISEEDKVDYYKTYIMIQKRKSILKDRDFVQETNRERDGCAVWEKVFKKVR